MKKILFAIVIAIGIWGCQTSQADPPQVVFENEPQIIRSFDGILYYFDENRVEEAPVALVIVKRLETEMAAYLTEDPFLGLEAYEVSGGYDLFAYELTLPDSNKGVVHIWFSEELP